MEGQPSPTTSWGWGRKNKRHAVDNNMQWYKISLRTVCLFLTDSVWLELMASLFEEILFLMCFHKSDIICIKVSKNVSYHRWKTNTAFFQKSALKGTSSTNYSWAHRGDQIEPRFLNFFLSAAFLPWIKGGCMILKTDKTIVFRIRIQNLYLCSVLRTEWMVSEKCLRGGEKL